VTQWGEIALRTYLDNPARGRGALGPDFRATVTYDGLEKEIPHWERRDMRTTSRLERINRILRRHSRAANAYRSETGLKP
jgi:hypothetical protein